MRFMNKQSCGYHSSPGALMAQGCSTGSPGATLARKPNTRWANVFSSKSTIGPQIGMKYRLDWMRQQLSLFLNDRKVSGFIESVPRFAMNKDWSHGGNDFEVKRPHHSPRCHGQRVIARNLLQHASSVIDNFDGSVKLPSCSQSNFL